MAGLLYRLGRFAARRRWLVVVAWVIVLALGGAGYGLFSGPISTSISIPGTATSEVTDELAAKFPSASGGSGSLVFETTDGSPFTDDQKADASALLARIADLKGVRQAVDPFDAQAQLDGQRRQVADGKDQLSAGTRQLDDAQTQLDAGRAQLSAAQAQLDAQKAQAEGLATLQPQLAAAQAQLDAQKQALDANQATVDAGRAELEENAAKLDVGERLLALSENVRLVSKDGSAAVGTLTFTKPTTEVAQTLKSRIAADAADAGIPGVEIHLSHELAQSIPSVVGPGEVAGLVVAALVLLIMLSTVIGAVLPCSAPSWASASRSWAHCPSPGPSSSSR
ncbi:hypothetical protein [Naasia aerilata]|uniref:Uncharacterized protein n=1 Tax=Naasia aerilata TaxID=1162966 RepID=A0ABN6XN69_9MICO|nr:hypothetical protein GCM10025866_07970 [Naasia aerilata]